MLYDRWQEIAKARRKDVAVRELATGRRWTFGQLQQATDGKISDGGPVVYPQGHQAEFVFALLRAWRNGWVACPLEPGQSPPEVPPPPARCCHLKTTSATSGRPRLVAFTAAQLAADADNIVATMGLRPDWPNLAVISLAHSYGFSNLVLPLLLHGIPLVIAPAPLPEMVRRAAAEVPDLTLPAVPALWQAWQEADAVPPNTRLAISAGAPLPVALEQAVCGRTGLKIHNFYGSSECGGIAYDRASTPRTLANLVGSPMQNVQLSVGDQGCLEVRGTNVGETYWPEPELALAGGCFRTSDLAELTDGQVFLRGRAGDLINVAGRKVAPESIEQVLARHPAVAGCLVVGLPSADAQRGETIAAVVAARNGVAVETLRQFLLEYLPAWQVPREWRLVKTLAADQRGKISRARWREKWDDCADNR